MFSIFESALELHEKGFSIVPVIDKQPAIPWEPYTMRKPTVSELRSWFSGKYDRYAIVTGLISGVVAVDCDGPEAIEFADRELPETPMLSRTPSGGEHRYYDVSEVIRNRVKLNGLPLDIRGERGVCIEFGEGYERLGDWDAPRPKLSGKLLTVMANVTTGSNLSTTLPGDFLAKNAKSLMNYIKRIQSVSGQRGHDACFRCACKIADAGLSFEESMQLFAWWNSICALPEWSDVELTHKLTDAFKKKGRS